MNDYAVARTWSTQLERGAWFEITYADQRRAHLIAGTVFIPYGGSWDFREADGAVQRDKAVQAAFTDAINRYRKEQKR